MFKKVFLTSILLFSIIGIVYPTKKENTKIFEYCYSLEKIISRNLIQKRKNVSGKFNSISKDFAKIGVSKTRGALINETIDQYKDSKGTFLINLVPNKIYCLAGYWTEVINPGIFESIFLEKSKKAINEFNDLKDDVDKLLDDINSDYKSIKNQFDKFF